MAKSNSKNDDGIKVTDINKVLPVQLTDAELLVRGQQLVENMMKTSKADDERKKENKKREGDIT